MKLKVNQDCKISLGLIIEIIYLKNASLYRIFYGIYYCMTIRQETEMNSLEMQDNVVVPNEGLRGQGVIELLRRW